MRFLILGLALAFAACAHPTAPVPTVAGPCWVTVGIPHTNGGSFSLHYKVCPSTEALDRTIGKGKYTVGPG